MYTKVQKYACTSQFDKKILKFYEHIKIIL